MDLNTIRTITIKATTEGIDESVNKLNALGKAQDNVAKSSDSTAKVTDTASRSQLRIADSYQRQTSRLDEAARMQDRYNREKKIADMALAQGGITEDQHADRLNLIAQRTILATKENEKFTKAVGLNRYELLNLSRQVQDVGVSLAGGQSPFVVMTQQGSQIFDVFQASNSSVSQFFGQAIGWASRFVTSAAGVATGVATMGASFIYAAGSWSSGQRDITRALTGIGAASGVTREQINQFAQTTSSSFGLSVSEAREAATAYAATGRIYSDNIQEATQITKDFARASGTDVAAATKALTAALLDPAQGAIELNRTLGFLDAGTLNYIRTLESQGKHQEAQKALMDAAVPSIGKMAEQTSLLSRGWDAAANAVSNYWEKWKAANARNVERVTGANMGGFSDQERMGRLQEQQSVLAGSRTPKLDAAALTAVTAEIAKLEEKMRAAAEAAGDKRFNQFTLEADAAARSLIPEISQLEKLRTALSDIEKAQSARSGRGMAADPQLAAAANSARLQLVVTEQTQQAEARRVQRVSEIALKYKDVGVATALALKAQKDQLAVASAFGGQQRLAALEQQKYNELLLEGKTTTEASREAAGQRAIAQAQINTQAKEATFQLQNQLAVSNAVGGAAKLKAQEEATYNQLVHDGVSPAEAAAQAAAQRANVQAQVNAQAKETLAGMRDQEAVAGAVTGVQRMQAEEQAKFNELTRAGVSSEIAMSIAAQQTVNAKAAVNASAANTLQGLRDAHSEIMASNADELIAVQTRNTYNNLIRQGVSESMAGAVAAQQRANAEAQLSQAQDKVLDAAKNISEESKGSAAYTQLLAANADKLTYAQENYIKQLRSGAQQTESEAAQMQSVIAAMAQAEQKARAFAETMKNVVTFTAQIAGNSKLFETPSGPSQFNPSGYQSSTTAGANAAFGAAAQFGPGGFSASQNPWVAGIPQINPTAAGYESIANRTIGSGGSLMDAINAIIQNSGSNFKRGVIDQTSAGSITSIADLLPDDQKASALGKVVANLNTQPETIARDTLIKSLTDSLNQLNTATQDNTNALQAQLDPLMSQGHSYLDQLKIGYYHAATGMDGIVQGSGGVDSVPIHIMATPGEPIKMGPAAANSNTPAATDNSRVVHQSVSVTFQAPDTPRNRLTARQVMQGFAQGATQGAMRA